MYNSKTKKPLDSIRRQKCDPDFKGFTFLCPRKVKDSLLALRAYNSMGIPITIRGLGRCKHAPGGPEIALVGVLGAESTREPANLKCFKEV